MAFCTFEGRSTVGCISFASRFLFQDASPQVWVVKQIGCSKSLIFTSLDSPHHPFYVICTYRYNPLKYPPLFTSPPLLRANLVKFGILTFCHFFDVTIWNLNSNYWSTHIIPPLPKAKNLQRCGRGVEVITTSHHDLVFGRKWGWYLLLAECMHNIDLDYLYRVVSLVTNWWRIRISMEFKNLESIL